VRMRNMRNKVEKYVNMVAQWERMNINPDVVRIKSEVLEASKTNSRLNILTRRRGPRSHNKLSFLLERVVPIGEAVIRGGFELNMEEHRSCRT
jgi:hypothetical protein